MAWAFKSLSVNSELAKETKKLMDEQYLVHLNVSLAYAVCIGIVLLLFERSSETQNARVIWGFLFLVFHGVCFLAVKRAKSSQSTKDVNTIDILLLFSYVGWISFPFYFGWHEPEPFEVFWRGSILFIVHMFHIEALRYSPKMLMYCSAMIAIGVGLYVLLITSIPIGYVFRMISVLLMAVLAAYGMGYSSYLSNWDNCRSMVKSRIRVSELDGLVYKDSLTTLFNRRYFDEQLTHHVEDYRQDISPFCVAILDIDYFKSVNDTYGHLVGDQVLKQLAQFLTKELRSSDILARYGGEEFIILMLNTNLEIARTVVDKLRENIAEFEFTIENITTRLTISIGVTSVQTGDDFDSLLGRADRALYQAKANGRNQTQSQ